MDFWGKVGFSLAIGGVGLSLAVFFATYLWRDMPRWIAIAGFVSGLFLCVGAVACFIFIPSPEEPEVTLSFVSKPDPLIQLHNISRATASNIKWMILAFDLDSYPRTKQPLPIPAETFDFLSAGSSSLPTELFERPNISGLVKKGDKIFGSASVHCPLCKRGYTYVFSIVLGRGGWYGEVAKITNANIVTPADMEHVVEAEQAFTELIPIQKRIEIEDPVPLPVPR
ncbi:MAG TPA: hypothetical protein VHY10_19985 [Xanthobacteraceae bacterium]|jgi:hypothetical protein|nr:hypothetical protein [Xanthobacteraceae bacterium]